MGSYWCTPQIQLTYHTEIASSGTHGSRQASLIHYSYGGIRKLPTQMMHICSLLCHNKNIILSFFSRYLISLRVSYCFFTMTKLFLWHLTKDICQFKTMYFFVLFVAVRFPHKFTYLTNMLRVLSPCTTLTINIHCLKNNTTKKFVRM